MADTMAEEMDGDAILYHHAPIAVVVLAGVLFAIGITLGQAMAGAIVFGALLLAAIGLQYAEGDSPYTEREEEVHNLVSGELLMLLGVGAAVGFPGMGIAVWIDVTRWPQWMNAVAFLVALLFSVYGVLSLWKASDSE